MTGHLRNLSGSQQAADHERRIRELERRLRVSQTDFPRRPSGATFALYEDQTGVLAPNDNSTTVPFVTLIEDTGTGITVDGSGLFTLPVGLYTVAAGVVFVTNATGVREVHLTGTVSLGQLLIDPPKLTVPALSGRPTHVSISSPVRSAAGADEFHVFGRQSSGGNLTVVGAFVAFVRHV